MLAFLAALPAAVATSVTAVVGFFAQVTVTAVASPVTAVVGFFAQVTVTAVATRVTVVVGFLAQVTVTPDGGGMPGGALAQKVLNWTSMAALWGSLASLLIGAMVWGISQHAGNGYQAGRGRTFAVAGAVGALLAGLAPTIVNTLFAG